MNNNSFDETFKSAGTRKLVVEVDYNDVDELITRHFPNMNGSYECVAYEEWNNYEDHSMDITGTLTDRDRDSIHEMINTGRWPHWGLRRILNYLCAMNVIEPAEYLISVSW